MDPTFTWSNKSLLAVVSVLHQLVIQHHLYSVGKLLMLQTTRSIVVKFLLWHKVCWFYIFCSSCRSFVSFLGDVYVYMAKDAGASQQQGAFRALSWGYVHWKLGRINNTEVNLKHPNYCHVKMYSETINEARHLPHLSICYCRGMVNMEL